VGGVGAGEGGWNAGAGGGGGGQLWEVGCVAGVGGVGFRGLTALVQQLGRVVWSGLERDGTSGRQGSIWQRSQHTRGEGKRGAGIAKRKSGERKAGPSKRRALCKEMRQAATGRLSRPRDKGGNSATWSGTK